MDAEPGTLDECQKILRDSIPARQAMKELSLMLSVPEDRVLDRVRYLLDAHEELLRGC